MFFTPTEKLVSKYKDEIYYLFHMNAKKITVNSCVYRYRPEAFDGDLNNMIDQSRDTIAKELPYNIDEGQYLSMFGNRYGNASGTFHQLVDNKENMNVIIENVKEMAVKSIIYDPEIKNRTLGDAINGRSFKYALISKEHIKRIKEATKNLDETFKDIIHSIENDKDKYINDSGEDSEDMINKTKQWYDKKIKWVKAMSVIATTYVNTYIVELKKLNRFVFSLVKRLLKTVDPKDIDTKKL